MLTVETVTRTGERRILSTAELHDRAPGPLQPSRPTAADLARPASDPLPARITRTGECDGCGHEGCSAYCACCDGAMQMRPEDRL